MNKVEAVFKKMTSSERFGTKFGMFPCWVYDLGLNHEDIVALIDKARMSKGELHETDTSRSS